MIGQRIQLYVAAALPFLLLGCHSRKATMSAEELALAAARREVESRETWGHNARYTVAKHNDGYSVLAIPNERAGVPGSDRIIILGSHFKVSTYGYGL